MAEAGESAYDDYWDDNDMDVEDDDAADDEEAADDDDAGKDARARMHPKH